MGDFFKKIFVEKIDFFLRSWVYLISFLFLYALSFVSKLLCHQFYVI